MRSEDRHKKTNTNRKWNITLKITVVLCVMMIIVFGKTPVGASALPEIRAEVTQAASSAEIQALLDLNLDGKSRLVLQIPAGEYHMTKTLYINPNTTIIASSGARIVKSPKGAILEDKLTDDDGGYDGNHDITVQGGIWEGTPYMDSENGTELFRFIHCTNITVKNVKLCNISRGHLLTLAGVKNAEVSDCEFSGYGTNPETGYLTASTAKEAVHLDVVHSTREVPSGQDVYYDDLTNDTITIKSCKFHEFPRGVGTHTAVAGMMHNKVVIENNTFNNMSDTAIRMYNYTNSVVRNNTISNSAEGVMIYTYINTTDENAYNQPKNGTAPALPENYNITVSNNTIKTMRKKNTAYGNGIRVTGISSRPLTGVKIQGNKITDVENSGIRVTAAPNVTISNNIIDTSANEGILLQSGCNSSVVTANKISNGKTNGISVSLSDYVTAYGNSITSVNNNGIYLRDADYCTIGKSATAFNTIKSAGNQGIVLSAYGTQGTGCIGTKVNYNQVLNPQASGILVNKSVNTTVKGNTVSGAKKNSVWIRSNSMSAKISENIILKSVQNGIAVSATSQCARISGNKITTYGTADTAGSRYGIIVYNSGGTSSTNTVISKNRITGSGTKKSRNAIQISQSPYVTVSGNLINKADGSGIYLYKSEHVTIGKSKNSTNTIKNPREYGIYVTSDSSYAQVKYNKISGAKNIGINVYNTKRSIIRGNTVSSEKDGIKVIANSSLATISGNTVKSAGGTGIWLSDGSVRSTIKGNTIKAYGVKRRTGNGIYVYKSGGTSEKNNTVVSGNKIVGDEKSRSRQKDGIRVSESSNTTVKKNTLKNTAGNGIYISGSRKNTVESNKITTPRKSGIFFETNCRKAMVKGNTIVKARGVSIMLSDAPASIVLSNKITGLKKYNGIWAYASNRTTIKSNTVKGTKKMKAISVLGSAKCKVSKNETE